MPRAKRQSIQSGWNVCFNRSIFGCLHSRTYDQRSTGGVSECCRPLGADHYRRLVLLLYNADSTIPFQHRVFDLLHAFDALQLAASVNLLLVWCKHSFQRVEITGDVAGIGPESVVSPTGSNQTFTSPSDCPLCITSIDSTDRAAQSSTDLAEPYPQIEDASRMRAIEGS